MAIVSFYRKQDEYRRAEEHFGTGHNRRCIDGCVTGCGNCVGFCKYAGHPGFLTEKLRQSHRCIENGCNYYIPKPEHTRSIARMEDPSGRLLDLARSVVSEMEGLKVTRVRKERDLWIASYVTLSNDYQLEQAEKTVCSQSGLRFRFSRLNLDFDTSVRIVMGV